MSSTSTLNFNSEITALVDDFGDGVALADPGEDIDFVLLDAFGGQKNLVCDFARNADDSIDVAHDDIAGADRDLADLDGRLVVRDHAAAERAVRDAVAVEHREVLLEDLLRVANAAGDDRAADSFRDGCSRHHAAPERGFDVGGRIPYDDTVGLKVVKHLGAERHFAFDHAVRRALHGERFAADDHFVPERHDVRRQVLVEKARFAHHVVDAAGVELLEALAEFLQGNRELVCRDILTLFDQAIKFHQSGLFGLCSHVC